MQQQVLEQVPDLAPSTYGSSHYIMLPLLCSGPWIPVMIGLSVPCYNLSNQLFLQQTRWSFWTSPRHTQCTPRWSPCYRALECRSSGSLVLVQFRWHSATWKWCLMRSIGYLSSWCSWALTGGTLVLSPPPDSTLNSPLCLCSLFSLLKQSVILRLWDTGWLVCPTCRRRPDT